MSDLLSPVKNKKWFFELVRLIGIDGARALMAVHGGKLIYIPKMSLFLQAKRDTLIYKQYCTGLFSLKMLASKWSLSQTTIHDIVKRMALLDGKYDVETEGITILKNTIEEEPMEAWKYLLEEDE